MFGFGLRLKTFRSVEWGFKKLSQDTFRVLLVSQVNSQYFKKLLMSNSDKKMAQELIKGIEEIKEFTLNDEYLKLMKTALSPTMKDVINKMKEQGVIIYDFEVTKDTKYVAVGSVHHLYAIIEGRYGTK